MIRREELRLGNFIEYQGDTHTVRQIGLFKVSTGWFDIEYDLCEAIQLTPEWLEKFGFRYHDSFRDSYECDAFEIYGSPIEKGWAVEAFYGVHLPTEKQRETILEYAHQLQNLYFALTGQELELKQ